MKGGHRILENLRGQNLSKDASVQKYLSSQVLRLIDELKLNKGK
jgi:hypothetical protein